MRIRFRLRILMLLVTLCAILIGMGAQRYRSYHEKQASWERLSDVFGEASTGSYVITRSESNIGYPHWSEWISGRFPSLDVVEIGMGSSDGGQRSIAEAFEYLRHFPTVVDANLGYSDVSDSDMCVLAANCPSLSHLDIEGTELTDASLACIAKLKMLKTLKASSMQITGIGFRQIGASCTQLEYVDISFTPITEAGLAEIASCTSLVELNLSYNNLSPQALRVLASADLPRLRRISLIAIEVIYTKQEKAEFRQVINLIKSRFPGVKVSYSLDGGDFFD